MAILERENLGAVARLTMNSPERINALSDEMLAALTVEFENLAQDSSIRAVILRGAGHAFCAGHDLKQMTKMRAALDGGAAAFKDLFDRCAQMMQMIPKLPQPVIAQPHGIATAAGCQLVASCDLAVAADDTRFGANGVNIGLFCSTPMVALSRNINRKRAFEMLTTGEFMTADEAITAGLINRAVPLAELDETTLALAQQVASKLAVAVKVGKRAFYEQIEMPLDQAYAHTGQVMVENMLNRDTEEGIQAFIEKRDPDWDQ